MNASLHRASNPPPTPRRHDIGESAWQLLEPRLPGRQGSWGGVALDNRAFVSAVFWVLRTGASWRELPPDYGDWKNTHRRFCRWRDKGWWEPVLEILLDDSDHGWLLTGPAQAHPHDAHARAGQASRYAWPWLRLVCRSEALLHKLPARSVRRSLS